MRPSKPRMQNFATKPFIETVEPSLTSQQKTRMESSKLPKEKDGTGATTRGDMTTQRTGNVSSVLQCFGSHD